MTISFINKKNLILIITAVFLIAVIVIAISIYKPSQKSRNTTGTIQTLEVLMKRLDKSIESIRHNMAVTDLGPKLSEVRLLEEVMSELDVVVTGILSTPYEPLAVINEEVVGIGDEIRGLKVIDIKEKSVTLEDKEGDKRIFYLYEEEGLEQDMPQQ